MGHPCLVSFPALLCSFRTEPWVRSEPGATPDTSIFRRGYQIHAFQEAKGFFCWGLAASALYSVGSKEPETPLPSRVRTAPKPTAQTPDARLNLCHSRGWQTASTKAASVRSVPAGLPCTPGETTAQGSTHQKLHPVTLWYCKVSAVEFCPRFYSI